MRLMIYAASAVLALLTPTVQPAHADTLVSSTSGTILIPTPTAVGQSVTTPSGGPFDALTFNFFDSSRNPLAAGTLFVLDQEYLDTAGGLNGSTPGFVAASQNIVGGQYVFDPTVTLQGAKQYFFYANQKLAFISDARNPYSGGILYLPRNNDINNPFITFEPGDANFRLSGAAVVPEPSMMVFLAVSALTGAVFLRRRNQAGKAA